jgi:hypothetical protein
LSRRRAVPSPKPPIHSLHQRAWCTSSCTTPQPGPTPATLSPRGPACRVGYMGQIEECLPAVSGICDRSKICHARESGYPSSGTVERFRLPNRRFIPSISVRGVRPRAPRPSPAQRPQPCLLVGPPAVSGIWDRSKSACPPCRVYATDRRSVMPAKAGIHLQVP